MSCSDSLLKMVSRYEVLEAAYEKCWDCISDPLDDPEEWLINLQNHLIWGSYQVCRDEDADVVVLEAITSLAEFLGLGPYDITGEVRRIFDELTLV